MKVFRNHHEFKSNIRLTRTNLVRTTSVAKVKLRSLDRTINTGGLKIIFSFILGYNPKVD